MVKAAEALKDRGATFCNGHVGPTCANLGPAYGEG